MTDKQHAHELLDRLPPDQLSAVVHLLERLVPSNKGENSLSAVERSAIAEADEWLKQNLPIQHAEILAEFGLTIADWEKMLTESEQAPPGNG